MSHDNPYRGGYTTSHYGKPAERQHALQVELARRLYMDEETLEKKPGRFEQARDFCSELVRAAGALRPA